MNNNVPTTNTNRLGNRDGTGILFLLCLSHVVERMEKAMMNGIEKEKQYQVRFPKVRRNGLPVLLTKMFCPVGDYVILDCPSEDYIEDHMEHFLFTEQEIRDIDERYLTFKVEVTP